MDGYPRGCKGAVLKTDRPDIPVRRFESCTIRFDHIGKKVETVANMPAINMKATGKNIEELRKRAGISVREIQAAFGFATPQAVYKWQHGDALPTIDNMVALAAMLDVRIDDILVVDEYLFPTKQG